MPQYQWEGKTVSGEPQKGNTKAGSVDQLRAILRKDGIILIGATETREKEKKFNPKKKIKRLEILLFTRQLSTMITSGLPLVQSLDILGNQIEDANFKGMVKDIKERIEGGSRFADALREYPQCFDELYINLVVAGEEGGLLDNVLQRLAVYIEKSEKLKKKVKSAMIYPIAIIVVALIVVVVLLLFVIPVFEKMFTEMGAELPAPTQMVIKMSQFMQSYWYIMLAAIVGVVFALKYYYKTDVGRRNIDRFLLKLPLFGVLTIKASVARVTRTLATLLMSGVAILESMLIVAKVAGNKIVEDALMVARSRISEGRTMAEPLEQAGIFPPMVVQMVQVGESTGALDSMLNKIADFYEEDVDNMVSNLTAMMEPMIMVFLGVILGGLIIAMYLPIFKLGQAVG
ncbi:MAG: type II secretion system F family protein [Syntrophorhabdaceae bacterium]|nr:type II secretion system F family protein [Syntrophorhabdaceae bacterium]MDD4196003.1 type II secretion system F family protein [Syntrophorhabdaceae bacterium]HOC46935.1 type II secretion system F family protein [Syntrophorhabdaceae bacterium]